MFRLDIRKHFFRDRVIKHLNGLSRELAEVESLEIFKQHVEMALGTWFSGGLGRVTLVRLDLKVFFNLKLFYDPKTKSIRDNQSSCIIMNFSY